MARDWLQSDEAPPSPADIVGPKGKGGIAVDFADYAELAATWLETETWPF